MEAETKTSIFNFTEFIDSLSTLPTSLTGTALRITPTLNLSPLPLHL